MVLCKPSYEYSEPGAESMVKIEWHSWEGPGANDAHNSSRQQGDWAYIDERER